MRIYCPLRICNDIYFRGFTLRSTRMFSQYPVRRRETQPWVGSNPNRPGLRITVSRQTTFTALSTSRHLEYP
jgi:hypothetical protein